MTTVGAVWLWGGHAADDTVGGEAKYRLEFVESHCVRLATTSSANVTQPGGSKESSHPVVKQNILLCVIKKYFEYKLYMLFMFSNGYVK